MDAAIAPHGKAILVDHEALHGWEIHVRWREQRFRFSVAHELGHYFLHATNMKEVSFDSIEGFKQWVLLHQGDRTAEYQADEFAGRLSRSTKRIRLRVATQRRVEVYGGHWTAGDTWSIPFVPTLRRLPFVHKLCRR